jgi:predicted nucleic acid-binding protein
MKKLVLNATPLIHIVRAGYSEIFRKVKDITELLIPSEVYRDVIVRGREKGAPDTHVIERLVEEGTIKVADVKDEEYLQFARDAAANMLKPLHEGEAEVLSLAREKDALAIVDESTAREIGRVLNISTKGSLYLFILLYDQKRLTKKEVIRAFEKMVKTGWRISPRDYEMIKEELERI